MTSDSAGHGLHRRAGHPKTCAPCLAEFHEDEDLTFVEVDYDENGKMRVLGFIEVRLLTRED